MTAKTLDYLTDLMNLHGYPLIAGSPDIGFYVGTSRGQSAPRPPARGAGDQAYTYKAMDARAKGISLGEALCRTTLNVHISNGSSRGTSPFRKSRSRAEYSPVDGRSTRPPRPVRQIHNSEVEPVATVNSPFELTVGSSPHQEPTVKKGLRGDTLSTRSP
jgi:hypothetical protein